MILLLGSIIFARKIAPFGAINVPHVVVLPRSAREWGTPPSRTHPPGVSTQFTRQAWIFSLARTLRGRRWTGWNSRKCWKLWSPERQNPPKNFKWWCSGMDFFVICENDLLRNGNSGLKMGVSRAAHTQYAYICKYPPPPPGTNMKQIGYGTPKKLVIICLPQPQLSIFYSTWKKHLEKKFIAYFDAIISHIHFRNLILWWFKCNCENVVSSFNALLYQLDMFLKEGRL